MLDLWTSYVCLILHSKATAKISFWMLHSQSVELLWLIICQMTNLSSWILCSVAGTAGAIATCPLEVVKTRLQSSVATFNNTSGKSQLLSPRQGQQQRAHLCTIANTRLNAVHIALCTPHNLQKRGSVGLYRCLRSDAMPLNLFQITLFIQFCWCV